MLHIKDTKITEKGLVIHNPSTNLCIKLSNTDYFDGITVYAIVESNGYTLTLSCAELTANEFHCKVDITKEMIGTSATIHCVLQYLKQTQTTPKIPVTFNSQKILLKLDTVRDKGYASLKADINALKEQLKLLTGGGIHNILPKEFNKETLAKGAVWTVIDDKGNCAFVQPFITNVEEINGIKSVGRSITLEAKHILAGTVDLQTIADRVAEFDELKRRLEEIEAHLYGDEGLR